MQPWSELVPGEESGQRHGKKKETSADSGNRNDPGEVRKPASRWASLSRLERFLLDHALVLQGAVAAPLRRFPGP